MQYIVLFLEGIITFISPCLLPMLPIYVSFFAAGETNRKKAFVNSLGFVLGFTFVFVLMGAFAGMLGGALNRYATILNIVTGLIVITLGLNFLGIFKIEFLNKVRSKQANTKDLKFFSSILFGIVFSIGWTPCVSAFLGAALMMASQQGGTLQGINMLLVYSLGLGIPFVASAVLIDALKGAFDFIKKNYKVINIVSGCLLIVVGILMATGFMGKLLMWLTF